jgi:hypothetical protein
VPTIINNHNSSSNISNGRSSSGSEGRCEKELRAERL